MQDVLTRRGDVLCRPWVPRNGKLFGKADFIINIRDRSIQCPAGEVEQFAVGSPVRRGDERGDGSLRRLRRFERVAAARVHAAAHGPRDIATLHECQFLRRTPRRSRT